MVENESWFYHMFRKNSVLVHAKTTTSYDTVENALTGIHSKIVIGYVSPMQKQQIR
jgi:hypothetical protein